MIGEFKLTSVLFVILMVLSGAVSAQITYSYNGANYEVFDAPYTANSRIVGSIQLGSALPSNATTDLLGLIQDYSFTDGQATRVPADSTLCQFDVTTNGLGQIVSWSIYLRETDPGVTGFQHAIDMFSDAPVQQSGFSASQGDTGCGVIALSPIGANNSAPALSSWSGGPVRSVPTLSVYMMLIMSLLLGLGGLLLVRKRATVD